MKKLFLFICFVLFSSQAFSQLKLDENFDYPAGDSIGAHGWVWFSGVANTVLVTNPGLTYTGYPLSGIGNAATLNTNGNDQYKSMTSVADSSNATSVYASFMVNITAAQRPGDYFLALLPSTSTTFFSGRVSARLNNGVLEFGLTKASQPDTNTMVWASGYSLNTTYVLVLKYNFIPGPANDLVSLFIFSGSIPATEPSPTIGPQSFSATSGDANNIGRIALRQGTATRAPNAIVDGIRVATSWFPVVAYIKLAIQGLVMGSANITDTMTVYLRNSVTPFNIIDTSIVAVSFANGVSNGTYSFKNAGSGTYYYDAVYRNIETYRNGVRTDSKNGGESVSKFSWNLYDFTTSASQAYGNNQVQLGSVFAIYNGDVNQDGTIDVTDNAMIDNDLFNFASGYLNTDLDGTDNVDLTDAAIADNNAYNFIGSIVP